jgi:hypothetical protein
MITNFQTVQDALVALGALVGLAILVAIAIVAIGAYVERDKVRNTRTHTPAPVPAGPAEHVTHDDDARELVLR